MSIRLAPYPEVIERDPQEEPYRIFDSTAVEVQPHTNIHDRELYAPLSEEGRPIALHECGHVAFSPEVFPDVDFSENIMLCVEDARINLGLERLGLPVRLHQDDVDRGAKNAKADLRAGNGAAFVMRAISALGLGRAIDDVMRAGENAPEASKLARKCIALVEKRLEASRSRTRGKVIATFDAGLAVAEEVSKLIEESGYSTAISEERPSMIVNGGDIPSADGDDNRSGEMFTVFPPLTIPRKNGEIKRYRPTDEGAFMAYPARYAVDRAIFRKSRRQKEGGTVLIDASGSMSLTNADIDKMLDAVNSSVLVAVYSGRGLTGDLAIVAKDGLRADVGYLERHGGNCIDEPALEWLGRQPEPRIWISDGGVTGLYDQQTYGLLKRVDALKGRLRIKRVETAADAAKAIRGG